MLEIITANQVHFHFFSTQTFSSEKYYNAWSLKGERLEMQEWFAFREANRGSFYNQHLENTLDAIRDLKAHFRVDFLEGINFLGENEWIALEPKNYTQIYDRLCRDKSKFTLYQNTDKQVGVLKNLAPNMPFWDEKGKNYTQEQINTFIKNDNLAPFFGQYDVYFNTYLMLGFYLNKEMLYGFSQDYISAFLKAIKAMFLWLCKGINADYACVDFSYVFYGKDYCLSSDSYLKNADLKVKNVNDFIYKRSFKNALEHYANAYYLNYFSKSLLELLDQQTLLQARLNEELKTEGLEGILSQEWNPNIKRKFVSSKEQSLGQCTLEEIMLYAQDLDFIKILKEYKEING